MPFWTRRKTAKEITPASDTGKVQPAKKKPKTSPPSPLEVKLLAMEALEAGLRRSSINKPQPLSVHEIVCEV